MAYMMRVCGLFERNAAGDNPYRYLTGRLNEETRVVVMPNREKSTPDDRTGSLFGALFPEHLPSLHRRAEARRRRASGRSAAASASYMGGATPYLPMLMRSKVSVPSLPRVATAKAGRPGLRSARSAGTMVTIGTFAGTRTLVLPPL